jgi:hypothetical protein
MQSNDGACIYTHTYRHVRRTPIKKMDFALCDLNLMLDDVTLSVECEVVEGVDIPVSDSAQRCFVCAFLFVTVLKMRMLMCMYLCVLSCFGAHVLMRVCVCMCMCVCVCVCVCV